MTSLSEIMDIMIPLVPDEFMSETVNDMGIIKRGIVDMAVRLGIEDVAFYSEEIASDNEEKVVKEYCTMDMTLSQKWLASQFSYRAYLYKLKDLLNRNAINFETLTFKVKGLEKRPESIDNSIYKLEKELNNNVYLVDGSQGSVLGKVIGWNG